MAMSDKRREEVKQFRRRQIMDASLRLFDEKGFRETTIKDIAEAAGISSGLIYRYFKSKDEILESYAELIEPCEKECQAQNPPTEALRLYARRTLGNPDETGYKSPLRVYIMCYIRGYLSEEMTNRYFRSDHGRHVFSPVIKRGQETGEFRQGNPDEMADLFWNYLIGCATTLVLNRPVPFHTPDIQPIIDLLKA